MICTKCGRDVDRLFSEGIGQLKQNQCADCFNSAPLDMAIEALEQAEHVCQIQRGANTYYDKTDKSMALAWIRRAIFELKERAREYVD